MGPSIWVNGVAILSRRLLEERGTDLEKCPECRCQVGYRSLKFRGKVVAEINIKVISDI